MMKSAIPEEIIVFEILKRLPVKSLCRFRAVSKRWLSIITSRRFTDSHFEFSKLNPTRLFEFYNRIHKVATFFSSPYPNYTKTCDDKYYRHYWHCSISPRGLICLYGSFDRSAQIWNPSTGERIEVNPKPPHKPSALFSGYFLGFDPMSKKHKLLSHSDRDYYLLTLGEKKWRKIITTSSVRDVNFSYEHHRCIDGILYYLARPFDEYEYLVAFDFGSESFLQTIRLPGILNRYEIFIGGRIGVNNRGRIVLLNYDLNKCVYETWVLEDVEKQKWSPKRIIPMPPTSPLPYYKLGVIDGEELLLYSAYVGANGFRLCKYDLEKGSWSETRFPNFWVEELDESAEYAVKLYYYVESLESPISSKRMLMKKNKKKKEEEEVVN